MGIVVSNLTFGYGSEVVLQDISFSIQPGKFTVILGQNGSGKSTLLKLVAGVLPFETGKIEVGRKQLTALRSTERAQLVGYLGQNHSPSFPLSCIEVVLTGRASYVFVQPRKEDIEHAEGALARVGIAHLRHRAYTDISGGERRLVLIARVLAQQPRIILLDEPLVHLDLANQARFFALVEQLVGSGLTVVAVLHDPNAAFTFGEQFVMLKHGKLFELSDETAPWSSLALMRLYDADCLMVPYKDRALAALKRRDEI